MKIILIGANGQVGNEIQELSQEFAVEIFGFDLDTLDITNQKQVNLVLKNLQADLMINAAAYTAVDNAEAETETAYAVNCLGVKNLALFCRDANLPLLHISTDYVFSGDKVGAYTEDDQPSPLSVYGKTKLVGDLILTEILPHHLILRVSWVFGKYGNNFVKTILRLAKEREVLNIVGDQFGCPTAARDIARVLLELSVKIHAGEKYWGIYNYCGLPTTTWYDFACAIVNLAKVKFPLKVATVQKITTAEFKTQAIRPHNSELQVKKIIDVYGIQRRQWYEYLQMMI